MSLPISAPTRARFGVERSATGAFTGSFQTVGTALDSVPSIIILDNQSTVVLQVSWDGVNVWKTFAIGEALVLDFASDQLLVAQGTQIYVKGTGGTGSFYASLVYAG